MITRDEALLLITPAELRVIRALANNGGSTKDAAKELVLARNTVRKHRHTINQKLGTSSITEVFVLLGFLRVPPERRYDNS